MKDIETTLGEFFASCPDATDEQIREFYNANSLSDYLNHPANSLDSILSARKKLAALRAKPLIPQRSEEWYQLREGLLTASDLAQALGKGKYGNRDALLKKKAFPTRDFVMGKCAPLIWGVRYEAVAAMIYQRMKGLVPLHEFGLIPHPSLKVFGASPDGITDMGVMLEIKCPYMRKIIPGDVPEHYMYQIQGQLEVCDLEYCDYIECVLKQHSSDQFEDLGDSREHVGVVAECYGTGDVYIYSPEHLRTVPELVEWKKQLYASKPDTIMCFHHWSLEDYNLVRVKRDRELFAEVRPQIEHFWADVLATRAAPVPTPAEVAAAEAEAEAEAAAKKRPRAIKPKIPEGTFLFVDDE